MHVGAFVLASDVVQRQERVRAQDTALDAAWTACMLRGAVHADDPRTAQWQAVRARVRAYLALVPSNLTAAAQCDEGDQLLAELAQWSDTMQAAGCREAPPAPAAAPPSTLASIFGDTKTIVLVLGGLYLLSQFRGGRR